MIHLKNDNLFWFILETQIEFNYGNRNYIEPISKDYMKIMLDLDNYFTKKAIPKIFQKKVQKALNRNELI